MTKEKMVKLFDTHELSMFVSHPDYMKVLDACIGVFDSLDVDAEGREKKVYRYLHYSFDDAMSSMFPWNSYSSVSGESWGQIAREALAARRRWFDEHLDDAEPVRKYLRFDGCSFYHEIDRKYDVVGIIYYVLKGTNTLIRYDGSLMQVYDTLPSTAPRYCIGDIVDIVDDGCSIGDIVDIVDDGCSIERIPYAIVRNIRTRTMPSSYQYTTDLLYEITPYHWCTTIRVGVSAISGKHTRSVPHTTLAVGDVVKHKTSGVLKTVIDINREFFPAKVRYDDSSSDYGLTAVKKMDGYYKCFYCDSYHCETSKPYVVINGRKICREHELDAVYTCRECGQRVLRTSYYESCARFNLCVDCYRNHIHECRYCGHNCCDLDERFVSVVPTSGSRIGQRLWFCNEVHSREWQGSYVIERYGYKPTPCFHPDGALGYLGVELEVDCGRIECAVKLKDSQSDMYYLKHDGSLGSSGIEIVTHPCTLEYHKSVFPWENIMRMLAKYDYKSFNSGTCGLHVHASRALFGKTDDEQWYNVAKLILFIEKNWPQVHKFSRRKSESHYACKNELFSRLPYDLDEKRDIVESVKNQRANRYRAINVQNSATIEFRLFNGTTNRNTLLASLEFVDAVIRYTTEKSIKECASPTAYSKFIASLDPTKYPYLVRLNKKLNGGN